MKTFLIEDKDDLEMIKEEYDEVIMNISEDIMIDNIVEQIQKSNTMEFYNDGNATDFFKYFEIRFNFIMDRYKDDDNILARTRDVFEDILNRVLETIEDTYEFEIEFLPAILIKDKMENVRALYEFFVINKANNVDKLCINYIENNKDQFIKLYQSTIENDIKTSLSYSNLKNIIDNKYTAMIFSIPEILEDIVLNTNEEVLDLIILDEEDELINSIIDRLLIEQSSADVRFDNNLVNVFNETIIGNNLLHRKIQYYFTNKYK